MKVKEVIKDKIKKPEYHPEKYTEKCVSAKLRYIIIQIMLLCLSFSVLFIIATKKIINGLTVMLSCTKDLNLTYIELFLVGFISIFIFIILLTLILYLLNKVLVIKITFKQSLSIVISSYVYFTIASILASLLFLIGWGYLGYILILTIFFLTQFNVYQTYYSLVEHHGKRFTIILTIIYCITSIIIFFILNMTLFNYIKDLYIIAC